MPGFHPNTTKSKQRHTDIKFPAHILNANFYQEQLNSNYLNYFVIIFLHDAFSNFNKIDDKF